MFFSVPNRSYLLWIYERYIIEVERDRKFPSPTGVTYYELETKLELVVSLIAKEFPSPTGVNYYESLKQAFYAHVTFTGFRPL